MKTVQAFSLYLSARFYLNLKRISTYFVNKFVVINCFFLFCLLGNVLSFICLFIFFFLFIFGALKPPDLLNPQHNTPAIYG